MKKIAIMAPTRNLEMSVLHIEAGASELYLGLNGRVINSDFDNFTFNARFNRMDGIPVQVESVEELGRIVDYAHANNVKINYTANLHYMSAILKKDFDRYIDIGLEVGVDALILSNFGVMRYLRDRKIDLPILAGVFLFTPNIEQTKFLQDLNVDRVVLPQNITFEEICEFKAKTDFSVEIFGHFGGGTNCGRCMALHSPTIKDIGPGCRAGFNVYIDEKLDAEKFYFLDGAADCCLCSVPDLMKAELDVLKIVGRESPIPSVNAATTRMYEIVQDYTLAGMTMPEIRNKLSREEDVWDEIWVTRYCERKRCRFKKTPITDSYII